MMGTNPDRVGVGLRSRAKQQDREYSRVNDRGFSHLGPLKDPMWSAMFQAMQEQGVDRLADSSVGEARGMFPRSAPGPYMGPMDHQGSALAPSNQIGSRAAAIKGFQSAMPLPESHESWMGRMRGGPTPVSATGQSRLRVMGQRGGPAAR